MPEDIWSGILTLISLYEKTKKDYDDVSEKLRQSEEAIAKYKEQIDELEKQIDNRNLRIAFLSTSGDEEAKGKIDSLIKEIDRCIAMLEK